MTRRFNIYVSPRGELTTRPVNISLDRRGWQVIASFKLPGWFMPLAGPSEIFYAPEFVRLVRSGYGSLLRIYDL